VAGETWSFFSKPEKPSAAEPAEAADAAGGRDTVTAASADRAAARPGKRTNTESAAADPDEPAESAPAADDQAAARKTAAGEPEPSAGSAADSGNGAGAHGLRDRNAQVTVVPGITRYHRGQCILIRFLGPEDLETMTLQAAEMASYVPCKACLPEQILPED
jgi:hypothetical protein